MAKAKFPKVSVIIPNWNGKHLLKICLPSILKQTFSDYEILVVDNGSVDRSSDYVEKYFPTVKVIKLPRNGGFAHGCNMGIKICTGKYMVLINNDTKLDKNCLENLVKTADKNKKVGLVAAKMLKMDNPKIIDSAGAFIDVVGHADSIGRGEKDGPGFNMEKEIFFITGGGSLIKREVFEKVGFLDEAFFAYFEDIDFSFRAQMKGFKAVFQPKAVIYHMHQATSKKNPERLQYLLFRNMMQIIIKDFPKETLEKNWWKIILVNLNTGRFLIFNGHLLPVLKAYLYIVLNLSRLIRKRREIQGGIRVDKGYILENIKERKILGF